MNERELRLLRSVREALRGIGQAIHTVYEQKERHHQENRAPREPPPTPVIHAELHTPESVERRKHTERNRNFVLQVLLTLGTWSAFFAAAYYAHIASQQKIAMDRQVAATQESNRISREALESVQRAFLTFGQTMNATGIAAAPNQPFTRWEYKNTVTNSGSTPAIDARQYLNFFPTDRPLPNDFAFEDIAGQPITPFFVAPKEIGNTPTAVVPPGTLFLLQDELRRIPDPNRRHHIYFWGWATYHDILPRTPLHISMFCLEITGLDGDFMRAAGPPRTIFSLCDRHNCTDDTCRGQGYGRPVRIWQ